MNNANPLSADDIVNNVIGELDLQTLRDLPVIEDCRRMIAAINAEANYVSGGHAVAEAWLQRLLRNRLLMERDLRKHPEIRDEILAPPLVITGFPRSGTTKLQRMMSAAPCFQALWFWKLRNPAPFPGADPKGPDPRIVEAEAVQEKDRLAYPDKWASHAQPATDADEDFLLQEFTFLGPLLAGQLGAPRYSAELTPIRQEVYEFERLALQYLQWQDGSPDRALRPWILKSPIHLGNIATMLRVFPGAKVVHCHRDLMKSVASLVRLSYVNQGLRTNNANSLQRGDALSAMWSGFWAQNIEQRRLLDPNSYCDVRFEDINKNGISVAERVCSFIGVELDQASRAAMLKWEADNERHKHGKNTYSADEYGLSAAKVNKAFEAYSTYFANSVLTQTSPRPSP